MSALATIRIRAAVWCWLEGFAWRLWWRQNADLRQGFVDRYGPTERPS